MPLVIAMHCDPLADGLGEMAIRYFNTALHLARADDLYEVRKYATKMVGTYMRDEERDEQLERNDKQILDDAHLVLKSVKGADLGLSFRRLLRTCRTEVVEMGAAVMVNHKRQSFFGHFPTAIDEGYRLTTLGVGTAKAFERGRTLCDDSVVPGGSPDFVIKAIQGCIAAHRRIHFTAPK